MRALQEIERVIAKTAGRFAPPRSIWLTSRRALRRFLERGLSAWDIAAGVVLVREAGGVCTEIDGDDFMKTGAILASNPTLAPLLQQTVRGG